MKIKMLQPEFSVCKVSDYTLTNLNAEYCFIGKTDEENSLVCLIKDVPANAVSRDDGWRAFQIEGVLDFSLVGILSKLSGILAENGIGIFALSTYNTDYILVKASHFERAANVLSMNGYDLC